MVRLLLFAFVAEPGPSYRLKDNFHAGITETKLLEGRSRGYVEQRPRGGVGFALAFAAEAKPAPVSASPQLTPALHPYTTNVSCMKPYLFGPET